jgi:hypothetical protein
MTIIGKNTGQAASRRGCAGPLAPYIEKFAAFLGGEGYAAQTLRSKWALVADLSHWLKRRGNYAAGKT